MDDDELDRLQKGLAQKVGRWRLPPGLEHDDVVAETMSTFWSKTSQGEVIRMQEQWLLSVARRKRKELSRSSRKLRLTSESQLASAFDGSRERNTGPKLELEKSSTWKSLPAIQSYALIESLMFGRPVSAIATEIQVNRSTVKSWISRIPVRLASDEYLRSFHSLRNR